MIDDLATGNEQQEEELMVSAARVPTTTLGGVAQMSRRTDPVRAFRDLVELIAFRRAPTADDTAERAVVAVPQLVEMIDVQLDTYLAAVSAGLDIERGKNDRLEKDLETATQRIRALEADLASLKENSRNRIQRLESEVATLRASAPKRATVVAGGR